MNTQFKYLPGDDELMESLTRRRSDGELKYRHTIFIPGLSNHQGLTVTSSKTIDEPVEEFEEAD